VYINLYISGGWGAAWAAAAGRYTVGESTYIDVCRDMYIDAVMYMYRDRCVCVYIFIYLVSGVNTAAIAAAWAAAAGRYTR